MADVKTFRISPEFGVPDKDIKNWLSTIEKKHLVSVTTLFIPAIGSAMNGNPADPRICVIATKLDEVD